MQSIQPEFTIKQLVIVLIVLAFLTAVAIPNIFESGRVFRGDFSKSRSDLRTLATALESYYVEHGAYPLSRPFSELVSERRRSKLAGGERLETVLQLDASGAMLTTPVAFTPVDPFAPIKHLPFAYHRHEAGWLLISAGPDRDYDIPDPAGVYDPVEPVPSEALVVVTYDPTNGSKSSGDVWLAH